MQKLSDSAVIATQFYDTMLDGKWSNVIAEGGGRRHGFDMPPTDSIRVLPSAQMGIACEGFEDRPMIEKNLSLPWFNSIYKKQYYFEVFNKGQKPFDYEILTSDDWIKLSSTERTCDSESRIMVDIDYQKLAEAEKEEHEGVITVHGAGTMQKINVFVFTPVDVETDELAGLFVEDNGAIAINAENFHRKKDQDGYGWEITKHLGVTGSSIGAYPFTAEPVEHEWRMEKDAAYAEYDFYCFNTGWVDISSYSLPTFPLNSQRHCLYGISVDGAPPLIIDFETKLRSEDWKQNVQRNQSVDKTKHFIKDKGKHTLKIWMIDTGVFIDKIVIDFGGLKKSYMGPEQTQLP